MKSIDLSRTRIIDYLRDLVAFQTVNGQFDEIEQCLDYIQTTLDACPGLKNYDTTLTTHTDNKLESRVWCIGDSSPEILLYSHIDVVSASPHMFTMVEEQTIARGRGVFDMKFAVAVYLEVLCQMANQGILPPSIGMMIVSDEEIGGQHGTKSILEAYNYQPGIVIMPDGGPGWHIVKEAKGFVQLKIDVQGKTAHASRPWQGESAVDKIIRLATAIRQAYPESLEDTQQTTVALTGINGGMDTAINQIPDEASLYLDSRINPRESPDEFITNIGEIARQIDPDATISVINNKGAFHLDTENAYVRLWKDLIQDKVNDDIFIFEYGTADHYYFARHGIPVIVTSPLGGASHSEDEWIDVESLVEYAHVLAQFLLNAGNN